MKKFLILGLTLLAMGMTTSCGKKGGNSASTYVPPYNPNVDPNGYVNQWNQNGYQAQYLGNTNCGYATNCGCYYVQSPCQNYGSNCGGGQYYFMPAQGVAYGSANYFQPYWAGANQASQLSLQFGFSNTRYY